MIAQASFPSRGEGREAQTLTLLGLGWIRAWEEGIKNSRI